MQIVTGLSNGQICVLYSPLTSLNGAKLLLNKGPPRKVTVEDMSDALAAPSIITPHSLPMYRDADGLGRGTKRKREKERMDPKKSKRPDLPVTGPGRGGRVGASATQHVVQNLVRDTTRDEDVCYPTVFFSIFCFFLFFIVPPRLLEKHMFTSWLNFCSASACVLDICLWVSVLGRVRSPANSSCCTAPRCWSIALSSSLMFADADWCLN